MLVNASHFCVLVCWLVSVSKLQSRSIILIHTPLESRSLEEIYLRLFLLFRSVVGLDGLRLNDHTRVGFLPVLALGRDGTGDIAARQTEGCT